MPQITVTFFAALRQIVGAPRIEMEIPEGTTVGELKAMLLERYPDLAVSFQGIVTSIGERTAEDDEVIPDGAHIALFHPIAGGSGLPEAEPPLTFVSITEEAVDLNAVLAHLTRPTTGAIAWFTGVVREKSNGQTTDFLEYEAYQEMALAKMRQVAAEIRQRWPKVEGIALIQRVGRLEAGAPTTIVACASPHRGDGTFEAAHYGIDRIKEIVPVWKKEIGPAGTRWVHGHYHPTAEDERA